MTQDKLDIVFRHSVLMLSGLCLGLLGCLSPSTSSGAGGAKAHTGAATGGTAGGGSSTEKGGAGGSGGTSASGGSAGSGGAAGSGGTTRSGGTSGTGGASGTGGSGGSSGSGGTNSSGGSSGGRGGTGGSGGDAGAGGSSNAGGTQSTGGSGRDAGVDRRSDSAGSTGGQTADASPTGGTGGSGTGGSATGGSTGSTINDGCLDDLAKGVAISEIAVFQAGKISVMKNGTAGTPKTTNGGQIIQGKDAVFRVYVTVDSGFQARSLSARLLLNGQTAGYSAKTSISASSTELTAANSFVIAVPGSAITDHLDYTVRLVECGTGSGTDHSPVFPATGVASLATLKTGPEKIVAVPMTSNGNTPTLDQAFTDSIKSYMDSMYPTSGSQVSANTTAVTGCTITPSTAMDSTTWSSCLDKLMSRRRTDKPANDVYYLGVLMPTSSLSTYCVSSCIMGISPVASVSASSSRVSLIVGYSGYAPSTAAHEIGHAHGLEHSPGCGAAQADPSFPYVTSGKAYIGWVGWDKQQTSTKFFDPAKYTDIMAYCSPQWVSDYVYKELGDRIIALGSTLILPGPAHTWRIAIESAGALHWGEPVTDPIPAEGDPVGISVLDAQGTTIAQIVAYRTPTSIGTAFYMVPDPQPGWSAIAIGEAKLAF